MTLAFVGGESKALNSAIPIFWYHMGTLVGIISIEQNTIANRDGNGILLHIVAKKCGLRGNEARYYYSFVLGWSHL